MSTTVTAPTADLLTELRRLAERTLALLAKLDPGDALPSLNEREQELLAALEAHGALVRGHKRLHALVSDRGSWAGTAPEAVRPYYSSLVRKRPHLLVDRRGFYGLRRADPLELAGIDPFVGQEMTPAEVSAFLRGFGRT